MFFGGQVYFEYAIDLKQQEFFFDLGYYTIFIPISPPLEVKSY